MPATSRLRLTPKIASLVATDRLRRPPLGRLTAAQAEQLLQVIQEEPELDEPVSIPLAIVALGAGRPDAAMPLLGELLGDPARPPEQRRAAAEGLGRAATPEAQQLLLGAVRDRDPRVQQATFKSLGWFADPGALLELVKVQARDRHAGRQLVLAKALVAHRHGLAEGPFLPEPPAGKARLTTRSATTGLELTPLSEEGITAEKRHLVGATYGIPLGGWGLSVRCGGSEWTVLVHRGLGRTFGDFAKLADRPWIAALLALRYPVDVRATTQFIVLTRPDGDGAHVDVVRGDGEAVYTGTAPIDGAVTAFSVSEVDRPSAAPVRASGRVSADGVELDVARAAPRRAGTPTAPEVGRPHR